MYPDFSKTFILDTDATSDPIGGVLLQRSNVSEHVIAYASRTLSKPERKYCVTREELLAVVYFERYFRHYLLGRKLTIRTDHSSLKWLMRLKNSEGQLARWVDILSAYDMDIEHRTEKLDQNADAISRIPCHQCGYREIEEKEVIMSRPELKLLQEENSDIVTVKQWLLKGVKPKQKDIGGESLVVKSLLAQYERLVCKDDILYRNWDDFEQKTTKHHAIIPRSSRRIVLAYCQSNFGTSWSDENSCKDRRIRIYCKIRCSICHSFRSGSSI